MTSTAQICDGLETFGATIAPGDIDNRRLPEPEEIKTAITCLFEPITGLFDACPLSVDIESTLWGIVNAFHAQVNRLDRALDDNERTQRRLREQHDGTEITDTQLTDAIRAGQALIERRNALLDIFDAANDEFEAATGSTWQPRHGSRQRTKNITAAMIDSESFERARKQRWTEDNLPTGPYVIVSGGKEFQNVDAIWSRLDRVREKHPSMTLLHGGAPGADQIAAKWADDRGIAQVRYGLDRRLGNRAGFVRNEKMLATMPIGIITFPGNGLTQALKREAKRLGVPVWDYEAAQQKCGTSPSGTNQNQSGQKENPTQEPKPAESLPPLTCPKQIIEEFGPYLIARHFNIKTRTVKQWLQQGVPASRIDALIAYAK